MHERFGPPLAVTLVRYDWGCLPLQLRECQGFDPSRAIKLGNPALFPPRSKYGDLADKTLDMR